MTRRSGSASRNLVYRFADSTTLSEGNRFHSNWSDMIGLSFSVGLLRIADRPIVLRKMARTSEENEGVRTAKRKIARRLRT